MCWKKTLFCNNILEKSLLLLGCTLQSTVYVQIKSTTLYVPSSELGLPTPLSPASVPLPPETGRGGGVRDWGSPNVSNDPNSDDGRKSLALCLLCAVHVY